MSTGSRAKAYRAVFRAISGVCDRRDTRVQAREAQGGRCAWFHAASAGELESLAPVAELWAEQGNELVLTVFSASGVAPLSRLAERIRSRMPQPGSGLLGSGFSPPEGKWREALQTVRPSVFITAKYEAWPELWIALSELGIPLVIIGARDRSSLRVCAAVTRLLGVPLPRMLLLPADEEDVAALRARFPAAEVAVGGEPRWDRVAERVKRGNPRAAELILSFATLPRPWGVLGSVWPQDLEFLGGVLRELPGSLWVVPHRIDREHVDRIEALLKQSGFDRILRTSRLEAGAGAGDKKCVLVDEMGFLLELYSGADYAFIGGGFGDGVHSTIEPGIMGMPIAAGPKNADRFPEIAQLARNGQLRILSSRNEAFEWTRVLRNDLESERQRWKAEARARLGATSRVAEAIKALIGHLAIP